jgi:16S rRNA (cytidine1402-2'-O)-methyltransferase
MSGTLYIVATPIGNLDDTSPRALRVLEKVKCVACEDTRRTRRLLNRFGVSTRTLSCHKFNERERLEKVLGILRAGDDVALVSDGGTPAVSDPGALLVDAALDEGIRVSPVPGPSAPVCLLSASGETGGRFLFEGFLPHRGGERRRRLRELRSFLDAIVLFESPRRIRETLADIAEVMGDRRIVVGRELTKIHETIERGTPSEVLESLPAAEVRGEITVVIAACDPATVGAVEERSRRVLTTWAESLKQAGGDPRAALRRAARGLGLKRAELYRLLVELGEIR